MTNVSQYLQSAKLPVMPEVAQALIRTLNDADTDVDTVCHIIAKDPVLTATLLRMANSAIFGLSRTVHTLDAAVQVIGMSQLRARALSVCMSKVFVMPQGIDRLEFWRYSMVCAGYARWLAARCKLDEQQAWLVGMMLRLGQITIYQQASKNTNPVSPMPRTTDERWEHERTLSGFDEGMVSAEIALHWDFPQDVVDALRGASQPMQAKPFAKLTGILHLSALLADHEAPQPGVLDSLPADLLTALQLDVTALQSSMPDVKLLSDISSLQG
jgi:HD-like signal output (HDOD) protein